MVPTERQLQETVARCVSIMVYFHNDPERTPKTKERMVAEVQVVAGWVAEMGLKPGQTDELILRPVEAELFARYGHELGLRLNRMFLEAIDGLPRIV